MGAGYADTRCHQYGITAGYGRQKVAYDEKRQGDEQQTAILHPGDKQHQRQRKQGHHPCIDGNQHAGPRLGDVQIDRNIRQQPNRHELRRIEDECGERQPHQRKPLSG